jgi:hypothetical protein
MAPRSTRPRTSDLSFQVFARTLHPDWFQVKMHRRVVHDGWEADIRIVDGGHAIHWRSEGTWLTESLVGPETPLPEPGLLFHSHLRHERTAALRPGNGLDYQTSFEIERCEPEIFDHLCNEAMLDTSRHALYFSFSTSNRMSLPAVSLIHYEMRSKGLSIHTFHSFPAERAVVRTHSLFESRLALPAR